MTPQIQKFCNFSSPHVHPQSLDSASTPDAFAKREVELGTGTLTCTDHGSLAASYKIYDLAKKNNLTPIIGCLMPGQEIHTIGGMKKIEDVEVGDLVLTHKGRWMPVLKTMGRHYHGPVYTITTARKGARGLTLTEEHPVRVSDERGNASWKLPEEIVCTRKPLPKTAGNKWKSASDTEVVRGETRRCTCCDKVLATVDFHKSNKSPDGVRGVCKECCKTPWNSYVVMPKLSGVSGSGSIDCGRYLTTELGFTFNQTTKTVSNRNGGGTHCWKLPQVIKLDVRLARFLGLFFAEGSSSRKRCSITFSFDEDGFVSFCVDTLRDVFSIKATVRKRRDKGTSDIHFTNAPVGLLLGNLVGVGAKNKKVPREILEHPDVNVRMAFWKGVAEGDGTKRSGREYVKLASRVGVWGLRCLIADFGAYSVPKSGDQCGKYPYWSVSLNTGTKWRRSLDFGDFLAVPIREIVRSMYDGPVFNIEVAEDHSYVSDFALHNCEAYVRDDNCPILTKFGIQKTDTVPKGADKAQWAAEHPHGSFYDYNKYFHTTLHFQDFAAYKAGVRLLSKADSRAEQHGSERKPLFGWNEIEELASYNTTLGSGCLVGLVSRHLVSNPSLPQQTKVDIAKAYFERLHFLFKDRLFIEVFPHQCSHYWESGVFIEVEKEDGSRETLKYYTEKKLRTDKGEFGAEELANSYSKEKHSHLTAVCNYRVWTDFEKPLKIINVVKKAAFIQNECSPWSPNGDMQFGVNVFMMGMAKKYNIKCQISDDSHFTEKRLKVVQDMRLAQHGDWKFYESYHRMTSDEAFEHFNKLHGVTPATFEGWLDNNKQWVEGFKGFTFDTTPQLPTRFFPKDTLGYTKELIERHGRMPKGNQVYIARLKKELDILHRNGKIDLLPYFHLAYDVCHLYQNQGQLTGPARGSAAGLLLSYLLCITHVDPIKNNLSLERFITKTRIYSGRLPDVDLDFLSRDLLVGYDTDIVEFEAADGSKHTVPEDFKLETDMGLLTAREAVEKGANFKEWWNAN